MFVFDVASGYFSPNPIIVLIRISVSFEILNYFLGKRILRQPQLRTNAVNDSTIF